MSYSDKAKDMYERSMSEVHGHLEKAKSYLEQLSMELYAVEISEQEWKVLDELLSKASSSLDKIN